ncbi:hypothetical protein ABFX02_09G058600 [Erythranthe guttata]
MDLPIRIFLFLSWIFSIFLFKLGITNAHTSQEHVLICVVGVLMCIIIVIVVRVANEDPEEGLPITDPRKEFQI